MTIFEIYNLLVILGKKLKVNESNSISFSCPQCKKHLITYDLVDNKRDFKCDQKYLYYDGDTVFVEAEKINRLDAEMFSGSCEKCGHQIAGIGTYILDQDIFEYEDARNKTNCFTVIDEPVLIKEFDTVKQYEVWLNEITIGYMVVYFNAVLSKEGLCDVCTDITRNMCQIELICLSNDTDLNFADMGVCNGHYNNERQLNTWKMAQEIVENIYDEMNIFLK